jgi:hypothetical protein
MKQCQDNLSARSPGSLNHIVTGKLRGSDNSEAYLGENGGRDSYQHAAVRELALENVTIKEV